METNLKASCDYRLIGCTCLSWFPQSAQVYSVQGGKKKKILLFYMSNNFLSIDYARDKYMNSKFYLFSSKKILLIIKWTLVKWTVIVKEMFTRIMSRYNPYNNKVENICFWVSSGGLKSSSLFSNCNVSYGRIWVVDCAASTWLTAIKASTFKIARVKWRFVGSSPYA